MVIQVPATKVLFIFGTRPEAIKLCPIIDHFRKRSEELQVQVCVTAQHRQMLDQVLEVFRVKPDYDLNVMTPGQTLMQSTSRILSQLEPVIKDAAARRYPRAGRHNNDALWSARRLLRKHSGWSR